VDGLVKNERRAAARLKRGGGTWTVSLDFPGAERELAGATAQSSDDEEVFRQERMRAVLELALALLNAQAGNNYYWQIMLPGGLLGTIVGFATQRYGASSRAAANS
jgi:hypothetical protein